jgi:hypothetical protein
MKRTFVDAILFFLAMNFIGIAAAVGVMIILGKLNVAKLHEIRSLALEEAVLIAPEKIKEHALLEEKYEKLKADEELRSKNEGLSVSSLYDNKIAALQKRENELKIYDSQIKMESELALKSLKEANQKLEEIKKRQGDYAQEKKDDFERSKDGKLIVLLKRYESMEPVNVAKALINSTLDPKLTPPIMEGKEEDPRVKDAAIYLKEMKPSRSAEIMETMGPKWINALQKYMEKMPVGDSKDLTKSK